MRAGLPHHDHGKVAAARAHLTEVKPRLRHCAARSDASGFDSRLGYAYPARAIARARKNVAQLLYYTVAGILLYLVSDWILRFVEDKRGKPFEHRSLVFFGIILVLAVVTFEILQRLLAPTGG
jgi:hypothetical protein